MAALDYNSHRLFYEIQGQGNFTLLFIHGLCGDHRVWSKNIPAFTDKYRVVTIDMFGHGQSSDSLSPENAFKLFPGVIKELVKKESLNNVILIGHSIAGNMLSSCIEQNLKDIRSYVFLDCTFNATERVVNSRNRLADRLLATPSDRLNDSIVEWYKTMLDINANPNDNELILSAVRKVNGQWVMNFLKATNVVRETPKTNLPVLIYESDWLTKDEPERSFYKVMPQADYSHWPVQHHFFFVYEAAKFNQQLKEFLDKHGLN